MTLSEMKKTRLIIKLCVNLGRTATQTINILEQTHQKSYTAGVDRLTGWSLIGVSLVTFIYLSVWIIILPFVDEEQVIQQYFPDRLIAVGSLLTAGVIGLTMIGAFVLITLVGEKKEKIKASTK